MAVKKPKAEIRILTEDGQEKRIRFDFNPAEYSLDYGNRFQTTSLPGFEQPLVQFVSGEGETLQMELVFDTTQDNPPGDVREKTGALLKAVHIDPDLHAPPICEFTWGSVHFRAVIEKVSQRYVLFRDDGVPVRAKVSLSFRRYATVREQQDRKPLHSSDVSKTRILSRADNLFLLAWREYGDPEAWRIIAKANELSDPLDVEPGTVLLLPPLNKEEL
ncbi:CIS tube protein [Thermosulfuriphilus sp.]